MRRRTVLIAGLAGAAALASGTAFRRYARDLAAAHARTEGRSEVLDGRFGAME